MAEVFPYIDFGNVITQFTDGTNYLNVSGATTVEKKQELSFAVTGSMQQPTTTNSEIQVSGRSRLGSIALKNIYVPKGLCKHTIVLYDASAEANGGSGYKYLVQSHNIKKIKTDVPFNAQHTKYLKFTVCDDISNNTSCTFSLSKACQYSLDGNTWTSLPANTATPPISKGNSIYFKGNINPSQTLNYNETDGVGRFTTTDGIFDVSGNPLSLIYGDNADNTTLNKSYAFAGLFAYNTHLRSAQWLFLNEVTPYCFAYMFRGCSNLNEAPTLPSLTLAQYCYYRMFSDCTSLTWAPLLPALNLVSNCYGKMFDGCTNLKNMNAQFLTTPSDTYTIGWLNNVYSTGNFYKNENATWSVTGTNGIPSGWTTKTDVIDYEIPMGTLTSYITYNYEYIPEYSDGAFYTLHYSAMNSNGVIEDKEFNTRGGFTLLFYAYNFIEKDSWFGDWWDRSSYLIMDELPSTSYQIIESPLIDNNLNGTSPVKFYTETCIGRGYNIIPDNGQYANNQYTLLLSWGTFKKEKGLSYIQK